MGEDKESVFEDLEMRLAKKFEKVSYSKKQSNYAVCKRVDPTKNFNYSSTYKNYVRRRRAIIKKQHKDYFLSGECYF